MHRPSTTEVAGQAATFKTLREPGEQGPDRKAVWTKRWCELLVKVWVFQDGKEQRCPGVAWG